MWIKESSENILEKESNSHYLNFLWNKENIYVMDNHLAAGWCWLNSLNPQESYNFFHVDRHPDLCGGLAKREYLDRIKERLPINIEQYCACTFDNGRSTPPDPFNKIFSWDNYIKQLQYMFPHWFEICYFACPERVEDNPRYTDLPLNIKYNPSNLEIYNNLHYWICEQHNERKWIFNLDLDYFFDNEGMQIYSNEYITAFANNLRDAMNNIAVLTIAMSPECCGSWLRSINILKIFSKTFGYEEMLEIFD